MTSPEPASPLGTNGVKEINGTGGNTTGATPETPTQTTPSQSDGPLARTPSLSSFALTEYSAKPTPSSEDRKIQMQKIVPEEFLLPNGNPDVSRPVCSATPPQMGATTIISTRCLYTRFLED